jgi:FAD/FMN-containing dehydrogenase
MAIPGHAALLQDLRSTLGDACVRTPDTEHPLTEHLLDWRGRYQGRALAVVSPRSTQDVAAAIQLCAKHAVAMVPQGGNTSLVGGSVPDSSGQQIVLSLKRLNGVLDIDPDNLSMTVHAGCTLAEVQKAAQGAGLIFPMSLASEDSCTIGGVLATNAGGTQVLRYGTARELCLGLEVVTAQGEVWSRLNGLRKDNTGYDLRHLLIGSEGTLGVITSATLRLYPAPRGQATALVPCADPTQAVALLRRARMGLDAGLTACELMAPLSLSFVHRHLPTVTQALQGIPLPTAAPLARLGPWWLLLEVSSAVSEADAQERLTGILQDASEGACLAQSLTQRASMWRLREAIPQAEKLEGRMVKHDIGLPTSKIPGFLEAMDRELPQRWPGCAVVCFGHLGDGNLHFNIQPPAGDDSLKSFEDFEQAVNTVVFDKVQDLGGTISAEHGIGELRKHELACRHPAAALAAMRAIKHALDPRGVLNPGRILDAR